ncbi:ABC transporter permease [Brassicibacter mesophilus]|uniref:ABC transporter permease n=1 Tax=Brassicibacter mesophilus TaxID=745119 RepID=UPI003D255AA6
MNKRLINKVILAIIFVFLLVTFIIFLIKLPNDLIVRFDKENMSINSNVSLIYMKDQIVEYYKSLLSGSLGYGEGGIPVSKYISEGFFRSLILLLGAIVISITFGIIKGIFDSRKDNQSSSTFRLVTTIIGLSMPDVFVIILIQAFVVWLYKHGIKFFPVAGYETARHAILPMISLSIIPTMYIARITSFSIDSIYNSEYIRTVVGKGASRARVIWIHVLRNAIVEIMGSFSSVASMLISSLVIVEYFFYYPGLTLTMYNSYLAGETDVVIGVALVIGIIYLILDLLFKGLRYSLNPKAERR